MFASVSWHIRFVVTVHVGSNLDESFLKERGVVVGVHVEGVEATTFVMEPSTTPHLGFNVGVEDRLVLVYVDVSWNPFPNTLTVSM
jgi:hypothetical protein